MQNKTSFFSTLSRIDIFGTPAILNLFGNEKRKSNFGGICSFLFFGFIIWTIVRAGMELLSRSNPNIIVSDITVGDPREIAVSPRDFPIAFIVETPYSLNNVGFVNQSIYTFELLYRIQERIRLPNGTFILQYTDTKLQTEECTKEYFGAFASELNVRDFVGSYCISQSQPDLEKLRLKGTYASIIYKTLIANVKMCDPAVSSVTCGTDAEISEFLGGAWFNAAYLDNVMDIQNFSMPTRKFQAIYSTLISPLFYKETLIDIGYLEVNTDSGWLTESLNIVSSLKMAEVLETETPVTVTADSHTKNILISCSLESSRKETYYYRSYKKIPAALAEVGGLANAALGILLILTTSYLRLKAREALMNEVFTVKGDFSPENKVTKAQSKKLRQKSNHFNKIKGHKRNMSVGTPNYSPEMNPLRRTEAESPSHGSQQSPSSTRKEIGSNQSTSRASIYPIMLPPIQCRQQIKHSQDFLFSQTNCYEKDRDQNIGLKTFKMDHKRAVTAENPTEGQTLEQNLNIQATFSKDDTSTKKEFVDKELNSPSTGIKIDIESPGRLLGDTPILQKSKAEFSGQEQEEHKSQLNFEDKNLKGSNNELRFSEYILSFIYQSKKVKKKLALIDQGIKIIDSKLDLNHMLQKFCEVDKLLALLLDDDQLELFNNIPKPVIELQGSVNISREGSVKHSLEKKLRSIDTITTIKDERSIHGSYKRIKLKEKKTKIDERLLDIFEEKDI